MSDANLQRRKKPVGRDDPIAPRRREDTPPYQDANLQRRKKTVGRDDPIAPQITLTTDKPAFFVWVNATGIRGEFDDNSFTLLPSEPRTLTFVPKDQIDSETFRNSLSVTDLSKSFDVATQSSARRRGREP